MTIKIKKKIKSLKEFIRIKKNLAKYYNLAIYKYHKLFRLPLTGTMWEQVLENILIKSGINILIPVNSSHQKGTDITVEYFGGISCKTTKPLLKVKKKI
jgi:hypothetical protein